MTKGIIHSIETFGSVDGPGIRFVIFLQGCPMRCKYCHNVDTWDIKKSMDFRTPEELIEFAEKYRTYWKEEGGITVSGGEPLMQIDFLIELFRLAHEKGINTCIDTSGQPFSREKEFFDKFNELMKYTDLLLVDIKHIDNKKHIELTGRPNENIIDMLKYLSSINKPVWIRHVLVPGITDDDGYLMETRKFLDTLNNVEKIDVLPYHTMGIYKWQELNIPYQLENVEPPTGERLENAKRILTK